MKLNLFLVVFSLIASQFLATSAEARRHGGWVTYKSRGRYTYVDQCGRCVRVKWKCKSRMYMCGGYAFAALPYQRPMTPCQPGVSRGPVTGQPGVAGNRYVNPVNVFGFPGHTKPRI